MRQITALLVWLVLAVGLSCDNPSHDQSWVHEWRFVNETADSLDVSAILIVGGGQRSVTIAPGQSQILARYGWFLGGPPDPSSHLDCLSVRLRSGVLVLQQHPVDDAGWQRVSIGREQAQMTRVITTSELSTSGVVDQCP